MSLLKQSTARDKMVFMTDSADHLAGKTGLTLTITASKNGAAFASISPTVTERGNGWYSIALTSSHTDTLGDLALHVTGTAADPSDLVWQVVSGLPGETVTLAAVTHTGAVIPTVTTLTNAPSDSSGVTTLLSRVTGTLAAGTHNPQSGDSYARLGAPAGASVSADVAAVKAETASIQSDTNDIQTRLPAALVGGKMDSTGGPTSGDIADAVWDEARADHVSVGSFGEGVKVSSRVNMKKSTAFPGFMLTMYDSTTNLPKTGLSVTAQRAIDGGGYATCANSVSEISAGTYKIDLSAGDLNGNCIKLKFTSSGALQQDFTVVTQE